MRVAVWGRGGNDDGSKDGRGSKPSIRFRQSKCGIQKFFLYYLDGFSEGYRKKFEPSLGSWTHQKAETSFHFFVWVKNPYSTKWFPHSTQCIKILKKCICFGKRVTYYENILWVFNSEAALIQTFTTSWWYSLLFHVGGTRMGLGPRKKYILLPFSRYSISICITIMGRGKNVERLPPICPRNRQADPPRIKRGGQRRNARETSLIR